MAYSAEAARIRKQQQRERMRTATAPVLYTRADWRLFINRNTLPQKAGCEPHQIGRVVLKELVDNALDAGAGGVTLDGDATSCQVTDDGPGIDDVGMLFAVNRPLISSKLKRLPTRGMLGNGLRVVMGSVAAFNGKIAVTSRGHRYDLTVDTATGHTLVEEMPALPTQGTRIEIIFPQPLFDDDAYRKARTTIALAGPRYSGGSHPSWYGPTALRETLTSAPADATVGMITEDLFKIDIDDPRPAGSLSVAEVQDLLDRLGNPPEYPFEEIGADVFGDCCYHLVRGHANIDGAEIPFCVEAWISCRVAKRDDETRFYTEPFINRSSALARLNYTSDSIGLRLWGCGIDFKVSGAKRAIYKVMLSLITPYLRLSGDGKAPALADFSDALEKAVQKAAIAAYRNMVRPVATMSIKDATWSVMKKAYLSV